MASTLLQRTWIKPALICGGAMVVGLVVGIAVGIWTANLTWIVGLSMAAALIGGLYATRKRAATLTGTYRMVDGMFVVAAGWLVEVVIVALIMAIWIVTSHPQDSGWFAQFVSGLVVMWLALQLMIGLVASASVPSAKVLARRQSH